MNIAMYHPWVYLKGGAERTLLELMQRSRHRWTLYTNHYDSEGTFPEFKDQRVVELGRVSVQRSVVHTGAAVARVLMQRLPVNGNRALMISSEGVGNLVGLHGVKVPVFCFCHTPLKIVYDPFTRERFYLHQQPGFVLRSAISLYTKADRLGWRRYNRVFCNSREVASRVLNAGLASPDQVEVAYPGVDLEKFDPNGPQEPFFLLAGRIARTKNVELAIDSFRLFMEMNPQAEHYRLVIAGMVDRKSRAYFAEMRHRANGSRDVSFVVEPSDAEMRDLYRRCHAALFTSLNEDWGLVPLEAMASAKPVISVGRGGPVESIVNNGTGILTDSEPGAFATAMTRLVRSPETTIRMGQAARKHVVRFSWDTFAARLDEYVEELLGERQATALAA